jgi:dihydrofolate synthase/folylpolyglutamate synthase
MASALTADGQLRYEAAVAAIFGNANYSLNPLPQQARWARFTDLLAALGDPHRALRIVHIAGTNGKGTTSAICEQMLRAAGNGSVGLFTSPHLHSWRERIRIDGALLPKADVLSAWAELEPGLRDAAEIEFTPFEKMTALALLAFRSAGVRWVVLETGLGGRWDCTNHVDAPLVVGLCRIGIDHVAVLGHTLESIASHKAGILKANVPAFSVPQEAAAAAVFHAEATATGAPLAFVGAPDDPLVARALALVGAAPSEPAALPTWLRPLHQLQNLALAAAMVDSLLARGLLPGGAAALDALLRAALATQWYGRTELVPSAARAADGAGAAGGRLIFDIAHNEDAVRGMLANLPRIVPARAGSGRPVVEIIFGANKDKDLAAMLALIGAALTAAPADGALDGGPIVRAVHLVAAPHPKACPPAELAALARAAAPGAPWRTDHATMGAALAAAAAGASGLECTLAFGSVFIVAEARSQLAQLRPDMFSPTDWAFEQAGEPALI